jgi:lysophospholipase L1-like esterase
MPVHVAIPTPGASWNYVIIGDSSLLRFPQSYAEYIEADLGVKVKIIDWTAGYMPTSLVLSQLRDNKLLRLQVSQAEMVTYRGVPFNYIMRIVTGSDSDKYDCSPQTVSAYKAEHDAIITEIFSLRKGLPTIIRAYNLYTPWYREWKEWGKYDEYRRCVGAFNAAIQQAAEEHGVLMADVHSAFNGPNDDEDPNDKGYLQIDRVHPNDVGARVMADLFRKLGYEPIIP